MRPLSYSQISRYQACPLWYKLLYIDKLKPREKPQLSFGEIIHLCAEYFFKVPVPPPPSLEKLLQFFETNWISEGYESPEQEQQYKDYGKLLLQDFWKIHSPAFSLPLAVEYQFFVNIDGIPLSGKIDRIDKMDGGISIVDYKTSKDLFTSQQLEQDQQLTFYQLAMEKIWKLPVKHLTLYHLRSNTACTCDGRNQEKLDQARRTILKVADSITRGNFPATENWLCPYCDFPEHCPYQAHKYVPEKAVETLPDKILQGSAARDVIERYAALQNQKKEIESKLDELKQMICDYCDLAGYKRLYGREHAITYKKIEKTGFTEEAVKQLLEPTGLWPRVLKFDPSLVKELLEADYYNPELRARLEALKQVISSYSMLTLKTLAEEQE